MAGPRTRTRATAKSKCASTASALFDHGVERDKLLKHLRNWGAPTPMDASYFSDASERAEQEIKLINKELKSASTTQRIKLRKRKDDLQSLQEGLESAVAPIRNVPAEVLERIFAHLPNSKAMLSVAGVCCRWRAVALSLPEFWTHLSFGPSQLTKFTFSSKSTFRELLDRSKDLDLVLDLELTSKQLASKSPMLRIVNFILELCEARLTTLTVDFAKAELAGQWSAIDFPALKELHLIQASKDHLTLFEVARHVDTLVLEECVFKDWKLPYNYFPNVTRLGLRGSDWWAVYRIIMSYHPKGKLGKVRELHLVNCQGPSEYADDSFGRWFTNSSLQSLKFVNTPEIQEDQHDRSILASFFTYAQTPHLQSLTVVGFDVHDVGYHLSDARTFHKEPWTRINTIRIGAGAELGAFQVHDKRLREVGYMLANDFESYDEHSTVTSLALLDDDNPTHHSVITAETLQSLTLDGYNRGLLPHLTSIELTLPRPRKRGQPSVSGDLLVEMVASRRDEDSEETACLEKLQISVAKYSGMDKTTAGTYTVEDAIGKKAYAALLDLEEEGLTLLTSLPPVDYVADALHVWEEFSEERHSDEDSDEEQGSDWEEDDEDNYDSDHNPNFHGCF